MVGGLPVPGRRHKSKTKRFSFFFQNSFAFIDPQMEKRYREEKYPARMAVSSTMGIVVLFAAFMLYMLAVTNRHNASITAGKDSDGMHTLQRCIIPVVCILEAFLIVLSRNVKKETHHQMLWFSAGFVMLVGLMVNSVAWKMNYDPSIVLEQL